MSTRRSRARGFTLLEVQVALIVLILTVLGLMILLRSHERLVTSLEGVVAGDPVLYVLPPRGPFEDLAGMPATLGADPPLPPDPEGSFPKEVDVQSVAIELDPPRARATVKVKKS